MGDEKRAVARTYTANRLLMLGIDTTKADLTLMCVFKYNFIKKLT